MNTKKNWKLLFVICIEWVSNRSFWHSVKYTFQFKCIAHNTQHKKIYLFYLYLTTKKIVLISVCEYKRRIFAASILSISMKKLFCTKNKFKREKLYLWKFALFKCNESSEQERLGKNTIKNFSLHFINFFLSLLLQTFIFACMCK